MMYTFTCTCTGVRGLGKVHSDRHKLKDTGSAGTDYRWDLPQINSMCVLYFDIHQTAWTVSFSIEHRSRTYCLMTLDSWM